MVWTVRYCEDAGPVIYEMIYEIELEVHFAGIFASIYSAVAHPPSQMP